MMRDITLKIGRRTGQETIVAARFSSEIEAMQALHVLNNVAKVHGIDPRSYAVVAVCEQHGIELMLCLAVETDHEAQIAAATDALQQDLSITVRCRDMGPMEYAPHALIAQMAKAQDN